MAGVSLPMSRADACRASLGAVPRLLRLLRLPGALARSGRRFAFPAHVVVFLFLVAEERVLGQRGPLSAPRRIGTVGLWVEQDSGVKGQTPTLHQAVSVEEPGRPREMDDSLLLSSFPLKITFAPQCPFQTEWGSVFLCTDGSFVFSLTSHNNLNVSYLCLIGSAPSFCGLVFWQVSQY